MKPFQQFIFKIGEGGFEKEVFLLIGAPVMSDDDERTTAFHPVLINLLISVRDPDIHEGSIPFKIVFFDQRFIQTL
jgi:hypothetical protein